MKSIVLFLIIGLALCFERPHDILNGYDRFASNLTYSHHSVKRSEILSCAKEWVEKKIPYCQCAAGPATECCGHCPHCDTRSPKYTRCDCSGYVSYCFRAYGGYTTSTLPEIAHEIKKDDLKPGDIMLNVHDHVAFFMGWADKGKTRYHIYQEPGCHVQGPHYAFSSITVYPMNWDPSLFKPYRYNYIEEDMTF